MIQRVLSYRSTRHSKRLRAIRARNSSARNVRSLTAAFTRRPVNTGGRSGASCLKTGSLDVSGCAIMKKSGEYVQVLKNASQLRDRKGNLIGAVETITDITEIVEKDKQIAAFRRKLKSEDGLPWNNRYLGSDEEGFRPNRKCRIVECSCDHIGRKRDWQRNWYPRPFTRSVRGRAALLSR